MMVPVLPHPGISSRIETRYAGRCLSAVAQGAKAGPRMTVSGNSSCLPATAVMPAIVAGIHVVAPRDIATWMAGSSPAMTNRGCHGQAPHPPVVIPAQAGICLERPSS